MPHVPGVSVLQLHRQEVDWHLLHWLGQCRERRCRPQGVMAAQAVQAPRGAALTVHSRVRAAATSCQPPACSAA